MAPVIPSDWNGFQARRTFRGATYQITVERAGPDNQSRITVDGRPAEGDVIPLPPDGVRKDDVHVVLY